MPRAQLESRKRIHAHHSSSGFRAPLVLSLLFLCRSLSRAETIRSFGLEEAIPTEYDPGPNETKSDRQTRVTFTRAQGRK